MIHLFLFVFGISALFDSAEKKYKKYEKYLL